MVNPLFIVAVSLISELFEIAKSQKHHNSALQYSMETQNSISVTRKKIDDNIRRQMKYNLICCKDSITWPVFLSR